MGNVKLQNWKGTITYHANSVEPVESIDQIIAIVKDKQTYPSPVRVKSSHHSTTRCVVAEGGTVIDMTRMNRIIKIDEDAKTITMEAGVLHIDAARELEKHGLQFYVNVEIGNLTVGSGACGGTKDASYVSDGEVEFGQVASYCVGVKAVGADGSILEVTEDDGELMEMMRASYGMLGVIYEVTYRVKSLRPMAVEHVSYPVEEFADRPGQVDDALPVPLPGSGGRGVPVRWSGRAAVEQLAVGPPKLGVENRKSRLCQARRDVGTFPFAQVLDLRSLQQPLDLGHHDPLAR